jgi:hypothetical protein
MICLGIFTPNQDFVFLKPHADLVPLKHGPAALGVSQRVAKKVFPQHRGRTLSLPCRLDDMSGRAMSRRQSDLPMTADDTVEATPCTYQSLLQAWGDEEYACIPRKPRHGLRWAYLGAIMKNPTASEDS